MTRWRTRPTIRLAKIPAATRLAARDERSVAALLVVVANRFAQRPARPFHQVRLDESVEITIEHPVDVADLLLGSMVLDHLIGMQHVAADLAAEGNVLFDAADLLKLLVLLADLD